VENLLHFTGMVIATMLAAASAAALNWLLLRGMFRLMQPAAASHVRPIRSDIGRSELVRGTQQLVRHFSPRR